MQSEPNGYYRFITNYQNHLTKFTILCPLKSKIAEEVACQLMYIFCMFGAPFILQSDTGREFANKIIQNLTDMCQEWSSCVESRDILKVKDQLKDPTKMFETCWLLGCPTTTRKLGLKDYGLPKQEKPSSAFRHQDKPLGGYVWNGAEDRTWEISAHWRHVFFNRNWGRTGTAL